MVSTVEVAFRIFAAFTVINRPFLASLPILKVFFAIIFSLLSRQVASPFINAGLLRFKGASVTRDRNVAYLYVGVNKMLTKTDNNVIYLVINTYR